VSDGSTEQPPGNRRRIRVTMGVTDTMPEGAADHRAEYGASIRSS
jgi:hypothetical protein